MVQLIRRTTIRGPRQTHRAGKAARVTGGACSESTEMRNAAAQIADSVPPVAGRWPCSRQFPVRDRRFGGLRPATVQT